MRISIRKQGNRNKLACLRLDGTLEVANLGPNLPHHDLAHYVVERQFRLREGFFGNVARGYTFEQLSRKEVIQDLGRGTLAAEILTRSLQSLLSGACTPEQLEELVNAEFAQWAIPQLRIGAAITQAMAAELRQLLEQYAGLPDGGSMELELDVESFAPAAVH
ncbi:MAG: hypothetical protein ABW278_06950 [Steroidobacteraceae bacterium]